MNPSTAHQHDSKTAAARPTIDPAATAAPSANPLPLLTHSTARDEREAEQHPLEFRLVTRLWTQSAKFGSLRLWLIVLVLVRSVQLPALTWVVAAVINGPVAARDAAGVVWGAVGFLALALSTQVVMHFRQRLASEFGELIVRDLRQQMFAHLQSLPLAYFHRTKVGRIISRMISDIEDIRVGVQEVLFVSLVQVGQMLVAAGAMAWYDWSLFLLVLGLAPVLWALNRHFHRKLSKALRQMRDSFSRVTANVAESVLGIRVTQAFERQELNAKMFSDLAVDHSRYNSLVMRTHGLYLPLLELNSQVFAALLLLVGGYRVLQPDSTTQLGDLIGFFFMANLFFAPITVLGNQYNQALTAMAGAERVYALLDMPPDWSDPPDATPLPRIAGAIVFDRVSFEYVADRPVLKDVSLTVAPGDMVALVGQTGSGKTTLINLLAKFYLPTRGEIRIDGHSLLAATTQSLHQQLGIVLQQNFLFQGTVADNIRFGRPDATDQEIVDVLASLDCSDLVTQLSDGLATEVGERGSRLSSGQRQLVCFARAMLADPRLLILDEATSSIDLETEQRLQTAMKRLIAGRTSFVIAHRLSTIRQADQILVLDSGEIVERGRHAELLSQGGRYAAFYRQFLAGQQATPAKG